MFPVVEDVDDLLVAKLRDAMSGEDTGVVPGVEVMSHRAARARAPTSHVQPAKRALQRSQRSWKDMPQVDGRLIEGHRKVSKGHGMIAVIGVGLALRLQ